MKLQYILGFLFFFNLSTAQNEKDLTKVSKDLTENSQESTDESQDYNKWSVEVNLGFSKGIRPFTENYFSSNPTEYLNLSKVNHYDLGFRYMLNEYFGFKLDVSKDMFTNEEGSGSLPFDAQMYGVSFQGVGNLGKVFHFRTFSKRFGLLAHAGVKLSQFTPNIGGFKGVTEDNLGVVFGFTPQFKISNRFALTGDFSSISNIRQHLNWDGIALSNKDNNLTGLMTTFSFGITYYIGRQFDVHADWYNPVLVKKEKEKVDEEARNRLDELESMLGDVDKDGVVDYLDFENNTPGGVAVDSRGRFIDKNNNSIPDELEVKRNGINNISGNDIEFDSSQAGESNVIKALADNGFLNIYFDINKDIPDNSSTTALFTLYTYLNANKTVKISLKGYADITGGAALNSKLSQRRSKFVHDFLVRNGVDSSRISFEGSGTENIVLSGNKEIDYRMSRRVSVFILD